MCPNRKSGTAGKILGGGDLPEKPGGHLIRLAAVQCPHTGPRQDYMPACPGNPHIHEPSLLLDVLGCIKRPGVGQKPLFTPDDEYMVELEPLGHMQGHDADCFALSHP